MTTHRAWRFHFPPTEDGVRGNHGPYEMLAEGVPFPSRTELVGIPPSYPDSADDLFVNVRLEIAEGQPVCTMLSFVQQAGGPTVTPMAVRNIDVREVIDQAVAWQAVTAKSTQSISTWVTPGGVTVHDGRLTDQQIEGVQSQILAIKRQRIVTDDLLREVTDIYKKCDDGKPTKAVMDHYLTGRRNAARWVSLAREAGFLEPYVRTKGRPAETKGN